MKKSILIPITNEIRVGDLAKCERDNKIISITKEYAQGNAGRVFDVSLGWLQKCLVYIVDTELLINTDDYFIDKFNETGTFVLCKNTENYKILPDCYKVIASNNPSLPIPQLTPKDIQYIIDNNGELGEFDVNITDRKANISLPIEETEILFNEKFSPLEEAAINYADSTIGIERNYAKWKNILSAFVAGAKYAESKIVK